MELRPYQTEAIDLIYKARENGENRQLVVLPTGTGKTVLFSKLMSDTPGRRLCLVHRDELVRQTVRKLQDGGITNVGVIKAAEDDVSADVVVASVQTLARERRLLRYTDHGYADLIVVDEAHHAPAPTYRKVIKEALHRSGLLVGVTATPDRKTSESFTDQTGRTYKSLTAGMKSVFSSLTYYRSLVDMVAEGWLTDIVPATAPTGMDLGNVGVRGQDWDSGKLGEEFEAANAYQDVLKAWMPYRDRPTIVFMPTVVTSWRMCETFSAAGISCAHVDGNTPLDERQTIYRQLRDGEIKVVTNCMVLTEGFDEPSVSCVIVARPTKSRALYAQMIGRGTRLYPGKTDCVVITTVSHDLDLSPVTLQEFLDDEGWQDGDSLVTRKKKVIEQRDTQDRSKLEAAFSFVRALQERPEAGTLLWSKRGGEWWLKGATVAVRLSPAYNDHWTAQDSNGSVLCEPLPLSGAVSVAELAFRDMAGSEVTLVNPKAKWRAKPPSYKQAVLAVAKGLDPGVLVEMSRGDVSAWLDGNQDAPILWNRTRTVKAREVLEGLT